MHFINDKLAYSFNASKYFQLMRFLYKSILFFIKFLIDSIFVIEELYLHFSEIFKFQ